MQPSKNGTDGGNIMCELEEQQEARAEVQGPKRRVICVYVRETLAIRQEEADEMGFVLSALSEPRGAHYWCDSRCSDKVLRKMQIASMVIEDRQNNLCELCYIAKHVQQGKHPLKS